MLSAKTNDDQGLIDYVLKKAAQKLCIHRSITFIHLEFLKLPIIEHLPNQGGKLTKIGDTYEVFTPGEKVVDLKPDSLYPLMVIELLQYKLLK